MGGIGAHAHRTVPQPGQPGKGSTENFLRIRTTLRWGNREVQQYLRLHKVDEVYKWLADAIKVVRGKVNTSALLSAFDTAISTLKSLLEKVTWLPSVGKKAQAAIPARSEYPFTTP